MFDELREMIRKWKENPHVREHSDESRFVLIALLKEGPLTLKELEEKSFLFVSQFGLDNYMHTASRNHREEFDITTEIDHLLKSNMIVLTHEKYELTNKGKKAFV